MGPNVISRAVTATVDFFREIPGAIQAGGGKLYAMAQVLWARLTGKSEQIQNNHPLPLGVAVKEDSAAQSIESRAIKTPPEAVKRMLNWGVNFYAEHDHTRNFSNHFTGNSFTHVENRGSKVVDTSTSEKLRAIIQLMENAEAISDNPEASENERYEYTILVDKIQTGIIKFLEEVYKAEYSPPRDERGMVQLIKRDFDADAEKITSLVEQLIPGGT